MAAEKTFQFISNDLESNKSQLEDGFTILSSNEEDIEKCFQSDGSLYNFINYLYSFTQANYGDSKVVTICNFFLEHNFHLQLIRLNEYYSRICDTLSESQFTDNSEYRKSVVFVYSQAITNFLILYSRDFSLKYFQNGGARHLLSLVVKDKFLHQFASTFESLLLNLSGLSIKTHHLKSQWYELDTVNILLKIAKRSQKYHRNAYGVILRIIDDNDLAKLTELQEVIAPFIGPLIRGGKMMQDAHEMKRSKMQFYDEEEKTSQDYDVFCVPSEENPNNVFALTSLLLTIYRLAVNDKIKYDLYVKHNVKEPVRTIVFKGSEIERKFAFQLLVQLCFDAQVLDLVAQDTELIKYINEVSTSVKTIKATIAHCKEILWLLNEKNNAGKKTTLTTSTTTTGVVSQNNQIMISYNSASRDLCLKIKTELERGGFKIWIDVNEIHGSSLDSMANAIDSSAVILMCVTEGYRNSVNCQAEAQYAFKHKKPIIPLIFEKGYEHVGGWLGMIMGDRIYISFIKYVFEDAMSKLLAQLDLLKPTTGVQVPSETSSIVPHPPPPPPPKDNSISKWSEEQVEKWFEETGAIEIYEYIKPCNGELLHQLFKMRTDAPEFFFQFISVKNKVNGREILLFTNNLEKLFSK